MLYLPQMACSVRAIVNVRERKNGGYVLLLVPF
jgi:hypothetical protein